MSEAAKRPVAANKGFDNIRRFLPKATNQGHIQYPDSILFILLLRMSGEHFPQHFGGGTEVITHSSQVCIAIPRQTTDEEEKLLQPCNFNLIVHTAIFMIVFKWRA